MKDNKVWDRLTKQEQQWILAAGYSIEDANDDAQNTAWFLRHRYAEFGFTLGDTDAMVSRVFQNNDERVGLR